jgi:outer membrane lipoprotein-sorting protein
MNVLVINTYIMNVMHHSAAGFLILLLMPAYMAFSGEDRNELEELRQVFRDGRLLHAEMTHEFVDSYTGETQVTQGEIWISKDRYKIETGRQMILVDGETSRVYNEIRNQLVISEYDPAEDDFAPSRFFSEDDDLYYVSDVRRTDDSTVFTLVSDDPFEIFLEVRMILDTMRMPVEIRAIDQMENLLQTRFRNARFLESANGVFTFDIPDDAEIIDLRN